MMGDAVDVHGPGWREGRPRRAAAGLVWLTRPGWRGRIEPKPGARARIASIVTLMALGAAIGACAPVAPGRDGPGAPEPRLAVERFLRLAAVGDYAEMGRVFGTSDGPVARRDARPDVERRMYALASLLAHDRAAIGGGTPVPGRTLEAVEFDVSLTRGGRVRSAPFVTVRGPGQRWYVERVDLVALAGRE